MDTRVCIECGIVKPLDEFYPRPDTKAGYRPACKRCWNIKRAASEKARGVYKTRREYYARRFVENRERLTALDTLWKRANRTKAVTYANNWRLANKAKANAITSSRRAKKKNATPAWANKFFIEEIYELARLRTEQKTGGVNDWHVDHIVPLKSDIVCGLHCEANLQVIPAKMNQSKKNYWWPDMPGVANG